MCPAAWGALVPPPRIESMPPELEMQGLTTGPPGMSLSLFLMW